MYGHLVLIAEQGNACITIDVFVIFYAICLFGVTCLVGVICNQSIRYTLYSPSEIVQLQDFKGAGPVRPLLGPKI